MSVEQLPPPALAARPPERARVARPPARARPVALPTRRGPAPGRARAKPLFVLRRPRPRYRRAIDPQRRTSSIIGAFVAGLLGSTLLLGALLLAGAGGVAWAAWSYVTTGLPDVHNLSLTANDFQSTKIYDRHGGLLYEISDPGLGKRTYLSLDQLPPDLLNATIAAEDPTFRDNSGVDLGGLVRAAYINTTGQGSSGGSTITMQLVRRLLLPEKNEATVRRKVRETIVANQLAQAYSKDKILTTYLNDIYYGSQAYGVAAAAEVYYGVAAKDLDLAQCALLAGLPQAPSYYDPHTNYHDAKIRQAYVLRQMVKVGFLTPAQAAKAATEDVHPVPPPSEAGPSQAPHFVNYVRALLDDMYGPDIVNRGGLRVFTTIDLRYQDLAQRAASAQIEALRADQASNAALVAINPRTGEILAMLGSVDYSNPQFGQVNVAVAPRQPGSSFKPFTYVTAFQQGYTPASMLADIPTQFDAGPNQPPYEPKDYDLQYRGPVLVRAALANSLNIPAVALLRTVGIPDVLDTVHRMGIRTLTDDPSHYGLALTLGGGEVTLLDMTSAYGTFANHGLHLPTTALREVDDSHNNVLYKFDPDRARGVQAITPQQAYLITDILADNKARTPVFGPNSALKLSRPGAAKTGTTEDYRDSWILGYTPDLAVGVWVGNDDNRPMAKVAGSRGAGPIWHNFLEGVFADPTMEQVLLRPGESSAPVDFVEPPGIVHLPVAAVSGLKPSMADTDVVTETFIQGSEPQKEDDWYKLFNICIQSPVPALANSYCPPEFVIQRPYLVLPAEFKAWAATQPKPLGPPSAVCCNPPTPVPTATPSINNETPVPGLASPLAIPYPTAPATAGPDAGFPGAQASITSPHAGVSVGGAVTITGNATADEGAFSYYVLEYGAGANPRSWIAINGQVTSPVRNSILGIWNTDTLPEGLYTLRLTLAGQNGATRQYPVPVAIERSLPKVQIVAPAAGSSFFAGDPVVLTANASAPQGLAGVEFYVDGVRVAVVTSAPYQFTWAARPGAHALSATAYSPYGHHAGSDPVPIAVGARPTPTAPPTPSFAIIYPQDQATLNGTNLAVVASAGPDSSLTRVDFYVDGWAISSIPGQGTFQFNWQTLAGRHTVLAIGYNAAGQEIARSQIAVYVSPGP